MSFVTHVLPDSMTVYRWGWGWGLKPVHFKEWAQGAGRKTPFLMHLWGVPPCLGSKGARDMEHVTDLIDKALFVRLRNATEVDVEDMWQIVSPLPLSEDDLPDDVTCDRFRLCIWLAPVENEQRCRNWAALFNDWARRKFPEVSRFTDQETK
jgi:hypothetical protein